MINALMQEYEYYTIGGLDAYGQAAATEETVGTVKMSIHITSQSIQDNINFKNANYVGFTTTSLLDDKCVIKFGDEKLKVLYIMPVGRYKQVFMVNI